VEGACRAAGHAMEQALLQCGGLAVMRRYEKGCKALTGLPAEALKRRMLVTALPTFTTVKGTIEAAAARGPVDVFQYSPRCVPSSRAYR
jgi:hypothetical protein